MAETKVSAPSIWDSGKDCIVTGSTGGIGLAVTVELLAPQAEVATCVEAPEGTAACTFRPRSRSRGRRAGTGRRRGEAAIQRWTSLASTTSAGTEIRQLRGAHRRRSGRRSLEINLMSAVRAARPCSRGCSARGLGTIVNVVVDGGRSARSSAMPEYSVMKAAMLSFSRLVADCTRRTASVATP